MRRIAHGPGLFLLVLVSVFCLVACGGGNTTTITVTTAEEPNDESSTEQASETEEGSQDEPGANESGTEETEIEAELEEIHEKTAEAEEASDDDEEGTCEAMGINSEGLKEGRCESEGQTVVVVDHDSTLRLKTLKVNLLGISKAKTLSSDLGSETATGTFVTFDLEVTNLTHAPVTWGNEQSSLYLDENRYSEDFEVQNGTEQDSLQWKLEAIQPQSSVTGTVTFDVPNKVLKTLYSEGNLDFINFGEEIYGEEPAELGIIRTYH